MGQNGICLLAYMWHKSKPLKMNWLSFGGRGVKGQGHMEPTWIFCINILDYIFPELVGGFQPNCTQAFSTRHSWTDKFWRPSSQRSRTHWTDFDFLYINFSSFRLYLLNQLKDFTQIVHRHTVRDRKTDYKLTVMRSKDKVTWDRLWFRYNSSFRLYLLNQLKDFNQN